MLFFLLYAVFFVPLYLMLRISLHSGKWLLCLFLITGSVHAFAQQAKWNQRYQTYIDQYRDMAIEQMLRNKIPASITLAQGLLESGAGNSELVKKGNNHFGIKCHGWTGRTIHKDDDAKQE